MLGGGQGSWAADWVSGYKQAPPTRLPRSLMVRTSPGGPARRRTEAAPDAILPAALAAALALCPNTAKSAPSRSFPSFCFASRLFLAPYTARAPSWRAWGRFPGQGRGGDLEPVQSAPGIFKPLQGSALGAEHLPACLACKSPEAGLWFYHQAASTSSGSVFIAGWHC